MPIDGVVASIIRPQSAQQKGLVPSLPEPALGFEFCGVLQDEWQQYGGPSHTLTTNPASFCHGCDHLLKAVMSWLLSNRSALFVTMTGGGRGSITAPCTFWRERWIADPRGKWLE